jgi:hypothetical protein
MNKLFLILGIMFVVATILFSGCVTSDNSDTKDTVTTNNVVANNSTSNSSGNASTDSVNPPEFPKD